MNQIIWIVFSLLLLSACTGAEELVPETPTQTAVPNIIVPTELPTSTQSPTAAPVPTVSASPMPTEIPTQAPPPTMTPEPLSKMPHNLLFIEKGAIFQLNKQTQQRETILTTDQIPTNETKTASQSSAISKFIVTADDQTLLVESQRSDLLANLDAFSLTGEWLYNIAQGINPLIALVASPDSQTILFIPRELGANAGPIMMRQLGETAVSQQIAYCEPDPDSHSYFGCKGVQWSPNNRVIIGQDGQGVWRISIPELTFSRILDHDLPQDGLDTDFERYLLYRTDWQAGQYWSPSGRYARIWVNRIEGAGHQAVLDMETNALITVPDSGAYDFPGPTFIWLPDDRLLLVRPSPDVYHDNVDTLATIEIWHIDPKNQQLVLDQKIEVGVYVLDDPVYQSDGRGLFHSIGKQPIDSNLWIIPTMDPLSIDPEPLTKLVGYDCCGMSAYWSADGEVGLFHPDDLPLSAFIPAVQQWLNLHFYVSPQATNFYWLE